MSYNSGARGRGEPGGGGREKGEKNRLIKRYGRDRKNLQRSTLSICVRQTRKRNTTNIYLSNRRKYGRNKKKKKKKWTLVFLSRVTHVTNLIAHNVFVA